MKQSLDITKPRFSEQILPVPLGWPFVSNVLSLFNSNLNRLIPQTQSHNQNRKQG